MEIKRLRDWHSRKGEKREEERERRRGREEKRGKGEEEREGRKERKGRGGEGGKKKEESVRGEGKGKGETHDGRESTHTMSTENVFSRAISAEILDSLQCKREENNLTTCSRVFPSGGSRIPTVVTMGDIWEGRGGEGGEKRERRKGEGEREGRGGKREEREGRRKRGGKEEAEREGRKERGGKEGRCNKEGQSQALTHTLVINHLSITHIVDSTSTQEDCNRRQSSLSCHHCSLHLVFG